ncbi:MAG: 2-dehydropantoate 2-reductase N-terminal domain-containing protein [Pseudonocardiaceae bacterium]
MGGVIVIVGSGVVGTATGKGLRSRGHQVTFVDIDPRRLAELRREGLDCSDVVLLGDEPAVVFLTLPTPNDGMRWDLSPLLAGTRAVGEALRRSDGFHTVVVRSTVPPGTTERVVQPLLEQCSGKTPGEGFALASNPEFLRARCALEDFLHPRMTVIGARSRRTQERLRDLLAPFGGEIRRFDDPAESEMIKCAHNLYNAAKISFWNELWQVARAIGADPVELAGTVARSAEASFNPEYGIRGGAPYGGACLPKDTKGFLGFAADVGVDVPLIAAVDEVNERMQALHDAAEAITAIRLDEEPIGEDTRPALVGVASGVASNGHGHVRPSSADG